MSVSYYCLKPMQSQPIGFDVKLLHSQGVKLSIQSAPENRQDSERDQVLALFPESAARALARLMWVCVLGFAASLLYSYYSGEFHDIVRNLIIGIIVLLACYREFRAGRIVRGLIFQCWGLWGFAIYLGINVDGIRTPILLVVPSLVMTVAWVQGKRAMQVMLVLSMLQAVLLVVADHYHFLPAHHSRTPGQILLVYIVVISVSGVVAIVLADNFKRLIDRGGHLTSELRYRVMELKTSELALKELNDRLEQRVEERTAQLEDANKELQKTVSRLELAQVGLVNAEKLASLGSMVAGISHELNTPIGNVLMITTSMEKQYQDMQEKTLHGGVKRSEFEDFLKAGHEMSVLAVRSTNRAVDLVSSFKQVAADQTSEQRRIFDLQVVIEDNIATLWPSIKNQTRQVQIENRVPTAIVCDSFPGPLGQVIVNLAQNAILHGFDGAAQGRITIEAVDQNEMVTLTVSDNGIGIAPHTLAHIFDPFFTTKLGKGGSGLGLTISYRIVTSVLGGNLFATSTFGSGAQFTLVFPKNAPFKF